MADRRPTPTGDAMAWGRLRLVYALWRNADGWQQRGKIARLGFQRLLSRR